MWGWLGTELPASLLSQALNCMNCTMPSRSAELLQRSGLAAGQLGNTSARVVARFQTNI